MIEPTFESLAHEKTRGREGKNLPAFVKIDLGTGSSMQVASQFGVRATPTFIFFLDGQKVPSIFVPIWKRGTEDDACTGRRAQRGQRSRAKDPG
jgi:hypothetical protein